MPKNRRVILHTTWDLAFPQWEVISDLVPVAGRTPVAGCTPEARTEVVLEAATAFRNARQLTFEQLYPLVPATFDVDLGNKYGVRPFSSFAGSPVTAFDARSVDRLNLHQTLAQANVAAAVVDSDAWPENDTLRRMASVLCGLSPEDFYLVVDVHIRGRDRKIADPYYFDNFGDEVALVLPHALAHAGATARSTELKNWLAELSAFPAYRRDTHPELPQTLGILEFTLAQALEALYPDLHLDRDLFLD